MKNAKRHSRPLFYDTWFKAERAAYRKRKRPAIKSEQMFSLVMPLFHTPLEFLADAVGSVLAQTYSNWELILVNGSPDDEALCEALDAFASQDARIKAITMEQNEGIVGNTNAGIEAATGDFVGFVDHDDMIEPELLEEYARALQRFPDTDFLYCDEDLFEYPGTYFDPLFKPEFNLDLLRCHNYIVHLYMIRTSLLCTLDLPTPDLEGAQDYDLTFKACERARRIVHIPRVLYHWRTHAGATNLTPASKPYAQEAGRLAVARHLERMGVQADVELGQLVNTYRVHYALKGEPKVSVIIPNKDQAAMLTTCVQLICERAGYDNFEIVIVENNSTEASTFEVYDTLQKQDSRVRVVDFGVSDTFNYAALINFGVRASIGEYLLLLNNDMQAITQGFMRELLTHAQRDDVGVVGAKLLYADESIQHAGVFVQFEDLEREPAYHLFHGLPKGTLGYHDRVVKTQGLSAVTGACHMVARALFDQVNGYDEKLAVAFNDIDFCLKTTRVGKRVVYVADVELYHFESVSRGADAESPEKLQRARAERAYFFQKWDGTLSDNEQMFGYPCNDPYFNRNFNPFHPHCLLDWRNHTCAFFVARVRDKLRRMCSERKRKEA